LIEAQTEGGKGKNATLTFNMEYNNKVEELAELNENAIVFDGIEPALIGWIERIGLEPIAVYDYDKVIECLIDKDEPNHEEAYESALEWYGYNTLGTWAGDGTPCFLHKFESEESECLCSRPLKNLWMRTVKRITAILRSFGRLLQRDGK
jgi:hypothetical protein